MATNQTPVTEQRRKEQPKQGELGLDGCKCNPMLNHPALVAKRGWCLNPDCPIHGGDYD